MTERAVLDPPLETEANRNGSHMLSSEGDQPPNSFEAGGGPSEHEPPRLKRMSLGGQHEQFCQLDRISRLDADGHQAIGHDARTRT
jgi:hypothetical protein